MKRQLCLLVCALAAVHSALASADWKLVWSDEFEYSGHPDPKRWTNEVGFIRNREAQYYTKRRLQNARVENGKLIIEARKETFRNEGRRGPGVAEYTSASLTTENIATWKHGRVEVRAKIPQGRGVWPAIWMLGENIRQAGWPRCGEIDIMEYVGFEPKVIHANIHTAKYNHVRGTGKGARLTVPKPFDEFHTYSINWTADRIDFFVDDKRYFTYERESGAGVDAWPFDQPFYLILNFAVGGAWGGQKGIDETMFPQKYEIDFVRVYQAREE